VDSNFPFRAGATTVIGLLAPDRSSHDSPLEGTRFDPRSPTQIGTGGGPISGDRHDDIANHMAKLRARGALRREATDEGADFVAAANVDDRALPSTGKLFYRTGAIENIGAGRARADSSSTFLRPSSKPRVS
jgi:hypothetical protein